jgi:preprotein translocase subunit SecG
MTCLAQMNFWQGLLGFAMVIVAGLLIIVILLQRGRGAGLTGAFGGSGGSSAFGAKTGDVFTWITVVVATMVMVLAIVSNYVFDESPKAAIAATASSEDGAIDGASPDGAAIPPLPAGTFDPSALPAGRDDGTAAPAGSGEAAPAPSGDGAVGTDSPSGDEAGGAETPPDSETDGDDSDKDDSDTEDPSGP